MSKLTKNEKLALSKIEEGKTYSLREASALVKEITTTKFDASVDIDVRLGVDPRKANQMVRGVVSLPHGTGKEIKVLVLCSPDAEAAATEAGADYVGLDEYIEKNKDRDIFIVLHQMGNHGPAYYKRYPKEFEKFTPVCKTNQLENCTQEEIGNAYDNAILYTDYFLSKTINFLKPYSQTHQTALFYISDHGESLGENGLYLHGMPYAIAPKTQKNVGSFIWIGDGLMEKEYSKEKLKSYKEKEFSHDNLFHTVLGLFEVETEVYKKELDILDDAREH